jgi:cardiolipin synthase
VRLLIDWLGNIMKTSPKFWRMLRQAGVEARSFGYPTIDSPLGWVSRDHRKSLIIDGRVAFVSGLCVGDDWTDDGHESAARYRRDDSGPGRRGRRGLAFAGIVGHDRRARAAR